MSNKIIKKSSKFKYHKVMEFSHQDIQPKVCSALLEVVLGHSTNQDSSLGQLFVFLSSLNHNSSLGQLSQRCWYSLHLRCQLQPTANFLKFFKNFIEIFAILSFSLCKLISERLLCKLFIWTAKRGSKMGHLPPLPL
jgi:hypothetical protein